MLILAFIFLLSFIFCYALSIIFGWKRRVINFLLLVLVCLPSKRDFGALTVKFSLNPTTTQKMDKFSKYSRTPLNHLI